MQEAKQIAEKIIEGGPGQPHMMVRLTRHREIMRRLLLGDKVKDIAKDMQVSSQSLYVLIRTEGFQRELTRLQEILFEHVAGEMSKFKKLVPFARQFYKEVLEDKDGKIGKRLKFDVSKDLLNRVGLKEPDKVEVDGRIEIGDTSSLIKRSFEVSQAINAEAVRVDPEGELERAEMLSDDFEPDVDGDQMAKELKLLMSDEEIEIPTESGDAAQNTNEPTAARRPTKEEEEQILDSIVTPIE